jgi:hypothetical protein
LRVLNALRDQRRVKDFGNLYQGPHGLQLIGFLTDVLDEILVDLDNFRAQL